MLIEKRARVDDQDGSSSIEFAPTSSGDLVDHGRITSIVRPAHTGRSLQYFRYHDG
jgi:hypothetical protein